MNASNKYTLITCLSPESKEIYSAANIKGLKKRGEGKEMLHAHANGRLPTISKSKLPKAC
jgi:hypothetical protein